MFIKNFSQREKQINEERAACGWNPYVKVSCDKCRATSEFRTQDELAASGWTIYRFDHELCPTCTKEWVSLGIGITTYVG